MKIAQLYADVTVNIIKELEAGAVQSLHRSGLDQRPVEAAGFRAIVVGIE
jgi:hypothetical protein